MTPEPWLSALLFVVVGAHALAVVYAYLVGPGRAESESADAADRADEVVCPACGATNERGYRYCGNCVTELPGTVGAGRRGVSPLGGRTP
jgi:hypothetical protein